MKTTLIVLAHPEVQSFNGAWARMTEQAARDMGHEVLWSDLYAMGFDPVEQASHYGADLGVGAFDVLKAQEAASATASLPSDVAKEIEKVRAADLIVFHFPIWWFGAPAILKGWCDRVLAHGEMHDVETRFDAGQFRGKKTLFCVTTGAKHAECDFNGKEGDLRLVLWPLSYTLRYLGFDVLEHKAIHGVHGYHTGQGELDLQERLAAEIEAHQWTLKGYESRAQVSFNADSDFDDEGRLKPSSPSFSKFIRHTP